MGGPLGLVKLRGKEPMVVPAGQRITLSGSAIVDQFNTEKGVILEPPSVSSLPDGIFLSSCLLHLPARLPYRLPVSLNNETDHDVIIPPNCIIAELNAVYSVIPQECEETSVDCHGESESTQKSNLSFDFGDSPLSPEWKERIFKKLNTMPEVFSQHDLDFGRSSKVKHRIRLSDKTLFKHKPRPIHPQHIAAVRRHLQELRDAGVIRESDSPFSSPIVVVWKNNGDVRLCIDYHKLNLPTVKDYYALPNFEESFSALTGSRWFSVLDLKSGYYQIEMEECDKYKTAFVCPLVFWEFNRMPQGITNAPSTFQRLMERYMGDLNLKEVLVPWLVAPCGAGEST